MTVRIELSEVELRVLVKEHLANKLGDIPLEDRDISIQVKSKQNYKSEWETAAFRAVVEKYEAPTE